MLWFRIKEQSMETFTAIIPVREYDEFLPDKNILPFGDTTLLQHKIRQLKKVQEISKIIVSTECDRYKKIALDEGVIVDDRPMQYAVEGASFNEFVKYIASQITDGHIIWCSVTAPLIEPVDYSLAISQYLDALANNFDSLITVNKIKRYILDENGPLNFRFDISKRSQSNLPDLYEFINGIVIAPAQAMVEWKYNWGHLPYKFQLEKRKQLDICTNDEYKLALTLLRIKSER